MTTEERVRVLGSPGSPYTRKMLAVLRFRQIPFSITWGTHESEGHPEGLPEPKVKLVPTFYFRTPHGELEAMVDSTPITRRLEDTYQGRSVIPRHPELSFYNDLIEDYADEWLTKAMFHYRWYHEADRKNAGPLLCYWSTTTAAPELMRKQALYFETKQFDRLYVVGSNDTTARTIEDSYDRFLDILDALLQERGYVLGARPCVADFAIYGQLTQLGIVDPTPASILAKRSPRIRAWLDRVDDLSGLHPRDEDWFAPDQARRALKPLLDEIGSVYAPFLLANAQAAEAGNETFAAEIEDREWRQSTFPYQVKCLGTLRASHADLPASVRSVVDDVLGGTGCEALFQDRTSLDGESRLKS